MASVECSGVQSSVPILHSLGKRVIGPVSLALCGDSDFVRQNTSYMQRLF